MFVCSSIPDSMPQQLQELTALIYTKLSQHPKNIDAFYILFIFFIIHSIRLTFHSQVFTLTVSRIKKATPGSSGSRRVYVAWVICL